MAFTCLFASAEQIALVGMNDDEIACTLTSPPLASVVYPGDRISLEADAMLDGLMGRAKPPAELLLIPVPDIERRASTDVLAVEDVDVDAAAGKVHLVIHWKGGVHTELKIRQRRRG